VTTAGRLPATEDLRCFVAAAAELNFRRAAARVGLTPAALGQRVRQMEQRLGVTLFERTTRRVRLTEAGERLLPEARYTLDRLFRLGELARGSGSERRLTISADARLGASWLISALDDFEEENPGWIIDFDVDAPDACLKKLSQGAVDAAAVVARSPDPRWVNQRLLELPFAIVASPRLVAPQSPDGLESVGAHTLLTASTSLQPELQAGAAYERVRSCGSWRGARELALRGRGVAHVPRRLVLEELRRGDLIEVLEGTEGAPAALFLVHPGAGPDAPLCAELANSLRGAPIR
jgi:LysR family transcriptional regulator, glycine cleavage system transcriptional activator